MTISSVNSDKSLTSNERIWKRAARYKEKSRYTKNRTIHEAICVSVGK